jgi:hypothetical protein
MNAPADTPARRQMVDRLDLRRIHPRLAFGTASDRYAGWIGQVYLEERRAEITTRKKRIGGQTFEERMLPVESVADYFEHFPVLELDFTFYRPLLEPDGKASSNLFVLRQYAEFAPPGARFLLKAPQAYSARVLRRGGQGPARYEDNPTYLDADAFNARFLEPAVDLLGDRLGGILFEQEYARVSDSPEPEAFVAELDGFFRDASDHPQIHLEVRSPHLLTELYFAWLESRSLGFVFSHWTWLPSIKQQWQRCGGRFSARDGQAVLRLLTPRRMTYEEAWVRAFPFDRPVPELAETEQARQMIDEATALAFKAIEAGATLDIISNNRAYGNAPALNQAIASRYLDFADRYGL